MIDKNSPIPLYFQIKNRLFQELENEIYKPGERLPAERLLAERFNVARTTLRQALKLLIAQGYLKSRRGSGIFVSDRLHYSSDKKTGKDSIIIGILLPDYRKGGIAIDLIRGIEDHAIEQGINTIVCNTGNQWDRAHQYVDHFIANKVSGVVYLPIQKSNDETEQENQNRQIIEKLRDEKIPTVIVDRACKECDADLVVSDNFGGGHEMTKHLIEMGHKRIAFIYDYYETSVDDRISGYKKALQDNHIGFDSDLIIKIDQNGNKQHWIERMNYIVHEQNATAVFTNDYLAVQVVSLASELQINIPDELSIAGYDNLPFTAEFRTPLTTIEQPVYQIGIESVKLIEERMNKQTYHYKKVILPNRLIVRKSIKNLTL